MQVELIGCTSAGKSTLAESVLWAYRGTGMDASMGADFVLQQVGLNWVKGKLARTILIDIIALFACLATWRSNYAFYRFASGVVLGLPVTVSWLERLNIARNTFKKVGIYELVRRGASDRQVVLLDEGTLHTAHYLFVHVSTEPNLADLATFAKLVPLPDVVVHVRQSQSVLIERTLQRGHKRIPARSRSAVECFIKRSVAVFEELERQPALQGRSLVVDGCQGHYVDRAIEILISKLGVPARPYQHRA